MDFLTVAVVVLVVIELFRFVRWLWSTVRLGFSLMDRSDE